MLRLYFAASLLAMVAQPCGIDDGLCPPVECDHDVAPCAGGATCHHGVCLTACDEVGRCYGTPAKCIVDDGAEFCADADGLPVRLCTDEATAEMP